MHKTDIAKLFQNGRSQAVRLPREFRFEGDCVRVRRVSQGSASRTTDPKSEGVVSQARRIELRAVPVRPAAAFHPEARSLQVNYVLDTNACIALINGNPASVRGRFQKAVGTDAQIFVPAIVSFELWNGVAKSARPALNTQLLGTFLSGPVIELPFNDEDARAAGAIRAALEASGRPIGAYDLLIAGQALARQLTLVTANVSEFPRVKGLSWQDWAKP